jgi:hypothetical protein
VYHEEDHGDEAKSPYPYKDAPPENERETAAAS